MRVNDVEGTAMLSKKRLDTVKNWENVESAKDPKPSHRHVMEENKGGLVVNVKGIRVFVRLRNRPCQGRQYGRPS
jgi:4-hydroxy-3-methylbut-2-enyl diphosphate reductase